MPFTHLSSREVSLGCKLLHSFQNFQQQSIPPGHGLISLCLLFSWVPLVINSNSFFFFLKRIQLPSYVCYRTRLILPEEQQVKTLRGRGLQETGFFTRQPECRQNTSLKSTPQRQGTLGIYEIKTKRARPVRGMGSVIEKKCGDWAWLKKTWWLSICTGVTKTQGLCML